MGTLVRLGLLAGAGGVLYSFFRGRNRGSAPDGRGNEEAAPVFSSGVVRDAGPTAQRDPVRREWDTVDEQSDESFPASDPPSSY